MQSADLVLRNGNILTLDKTSRTASAVAITGTKVTAVGSEEEIDAHVAPETRTIDLKGQTAMPGLFDGHPHMDREGLKAFGGIPIGGLNSIDAIVAKVKDAVTRTVPGEWIVLMPLGSPPLGYFHDAKQLREGRFPDRHDLDAVAPDNPVFIRSVWGWWSTPPFPSVANSMALRLAGVTKTTPSPYNVTIVKDTKGVPTGVFLERNRTPILEYTLFKVLPRFTYEDRVNGVRLGAKIYSQLGTTSGYEGHGLTPALIRAYNKVSADDELPVRLTAPISIPSPAKSVEDIKDLLYHCAAYTSGLGSGNGAFRTNGVTLDLGDREVASTIALDYPYEQWASFFYQGLTDAEFVDIGVHAARLGIRINAIAADAPPVYSLDRMLRLMEAVNEQVSIRDLRCVGVHLMGGSSEQLRRFRELGLAATVTPGMMYSHAAAFSLNGRGDDALPIRRMLDAGIPITLSTDNVPPSMLFTAWETLARWNDTDKQVEGNSHLTREEVLRLSAQTGHYLNWEEDSRGMIAPGYAADVVVWNDNPLTCDLDLLPQLQAELTVMDGNVRYERAANAV